MEWFQLLSQPITQVGGVVGILSLLHKSGILDVKQVLRSTLGIDSGGEGTESGNAMQTLGYKIDQLTQYANHDTTKMHEKTHEMLEKFHDVIRDNTQVLREIKEYGIKCRE